MGSTVLDSGKVPGTLMEIQKAQQAGIPTDVRKAEGWGIVTVAPWASVIEPAVIVDPAAPPVIHLPIHVTDFLQGWVRPGGNSQL